MKLFELNWEEGLQNLVRLLVALILAIPMAWERGIGAQSVGFRTFPIVGMASCGFVLIARIAAAEDSSILGNAIQGLLSGIGFIGGGAILKVRSNVQGLVTAASIWNTGAMGIAVALGELEIAVFLSLINFLALYFLTPVAELGYLDPKNGLLKASEEKKGLYDADGNEIKMEKE